MWEEEGRHHDVRDPLLGLLTWKEFGLMNESDDVGLFVHHIRHLFVTWWNAYLDMGRY